MCAGASPRICAARYPCALKAPPPLQTELELDIEDATAQLRHGTQLLAEARLTGLELSAPACPAFAVAAAAVKSYAGFTRHAFPRCFVCGTQSAPGDGLQIFPGPVPGQAMVAATWTPDASLCHGENRVRSEYVWAALDCPGAFAVMPVAPGQALVLGELCVRIDAEIEVDKPCIVVAWPLQIEGRRRLAGSTLYSGSGHLLAAGRATWLEVPARAFGGQ